MLILTHHKKDIHFNNLIMSNSNDNNRGDNSDGGLLILFIGLVLSVIFTIGAIIYFNSITPILSVLVLIGLFLIVRWLFINVGD